MSFHSIHDDTSIDAKSRKRKRDRDDSIELDTRPFTIRPDASDPLGRPRTFIPLFVLSRAQLPLAYLDTRNTGSRLFSANIHALEACHDFEDEASVLVAEEQKEGGLYAIERAQRRTYALCKLGAWVKREELEARSRVFLRGPEPQIKRQAVQPLENGQPWWSHAAVAVQVGGHEESAGCSSVPKLAMLEPEQPQQNLQTDCVEQDQADGPTQMDNAERPTEPHGVERALPVNLSAHDLLQELAKNYLEALYLSRTSLAYFTKGPLSRARAAFSSTTESAAQQSDLIAFLRDSLLTSTIMDTKYKDGLQNIIKDLPVPDTETPNKATNQRKKRRWKAKRDKAGLFADENDYVQRWWREQDGEGTALSSAETMYAALRRRVPHLRSRETYLQVIVALEVLALEASQPPASKVKALPAADSQDVESQTIDSQAVDSQAAQTGKKRKPKKTQDLPALLDTLVDKLCIWQSLEANSPAKKSGEDAQREGDDELKSFCIEVIVPFYMSRIPQHAATVNKKLGGPSAPTPVKRKTTSSRKPGEPAVRQAPEKKTRTPLARVSTDTLNQESRQPPALHRSSTDTDLLLPRIKREGTETPSLDSIPAAKAPRKRTSLMHSLSFANKREVDLSAMSQVNEARLRKKAEVEEKLREAISTLKKPNRSLANREVADRADERFAVATAAKGRKAAKPVMGADVQATPKHVKATPHSHVQHVPVSRETFMRSSGGTSIVPSSSARLKAPPPAALNQAPLQSTPAVPQTGHRPRHLPASVAETPSLGHAAQSLFLYPGVDAPQPLAAFESPVAARKAPAFQQTPTRPFRPLALVAEATPVRPLIAASPNPVRSGGAGLGREAAGEEKRAKSIYDAMGWDDEYEELA